MFRSIRMCVMPPSTMGSRLLRMLGVRRLSVLMMVVMAALPGCSSSTGSDGSAEIAGYRIGSDQVYPSQVHSVSVPIFENLTFTTGIERDVTSAVIKAIQLRTPYYVTGGNGGGDADSQLKGKIVDVQKTRLNLQNGTGLVREMVVSITVDFEWKDLHTGKTLVSRQHFKSSGEYIPAHPTDEPEQIGQYAAASQLADLIVDAMRDDW